MKRNILKSFAAITAISGLSLSVATAGVTSGTSILCMDGNSSSKNHDENVTIDLKNSGVTDLNLTLIPAANYKGASFKLEFTNGGIPEDDEVLLCVGDTKVGSLQEPGTIVNGLLVKPTFSFIDNDAVAALINKDSNITFETTSDCATDGNTSEYLNVVGLADAACQTISAKTVEPFSTQGQDIPSLKSNASNFGTTKSFINIACTAPQCFVTGDKLLFTNSAKAAGVNVALTDSTNGAEPTSYTSGGCPECGETAAVITCVTDIHIQNENTDFNITGLDLVANFSNGELKMDNINLSIYNMNTGSDVNITENYTLGQTFSPSGLNIGPDGNATIHMEFTPTTTDIIAMGDITANITGMDSNISTNDVIPTFTDKKIATIQMGAETQFTVPYMNGAVSSMAKITTRADGETTLVADITDSNGKTCSVTLDSIPAGSSTMVFANSKVGRTAPYQNLIDAGECADLESTEYSVVFTTNAAVDVVSYMTMSNGSQRYVDVY